MQPIHAQPVLVAQNTSSDSPAAGFKTTPIFEDIAKKIEKVSKSLALEIFSNLIVKVLLKS